MVGHSTAAVYRSAAEYEAAFGAAGFEVVATANVEVYAQRFGNADQIMWVLRG